MLFKVFRKLGVISGHFTLSLSVHGTFILLHFLNLRVELFHLLRRGVVHLGKFISLLFGFSEGFVSYEELLLHLLETFLEALDLVSIFSCFNLLRLFFLHFSLGLCFNLISFLLDLGFGLDFLLFGLYGSFLCLLFCLMGGLLFSSELFLLSFDWLFCYGIILDLGFFVGLFDSLSFLLRLFLCFLARRSGLAVLVDI